MRSYQPDGQGKNGIDGKRKDGKEWKPCSLERSGGYILRTKKQKVYPKENRKIYPKGDPQDLSTPLNHSPFLVIYM